MALFFHINVISVSFYHFIDWAISFSENSQALRAKSSSLACLDSAFTAQSLKKGTIEL